ncbi:MAG: hypothetical protein M3P98_02015 [bacterium]|nr:hypothetical protein [bacterium]
MEPKPKQIIKLNPNIIGKADLIRLQRELGDLEDKVSKAKAKKTHEKISITGALHTLASDNGYDLNKELERQKLADELHKLIEKAPSLQISFASTPSQDFMSKLAAWFRKEVHPQALVSVGLQPNIAAGCVLRTTSRVFDLSLKKIMLAKQELLVSNIRGVHGK